MFAKLLLTALIIGGAVLVIKGRSRPAAAARPVREDTASVSPRVMAYALLAIVLLTTAGLSYYHWRDTRTVITIQLVNSATGDTVTYQAYRSKVGTRSFETLDGRVVSVADVDRMEIIE